MKTKPYCKAVGSLMHVLLGTQPDITYAVGILSRFIQNPRLPHWHAVKQVFAYLTGIKDLWLTYGTLSMELEGYSDADGSMHEDWKAIVTPCARHIQILHLHMFPYPDNPPSTSVTHPTLFMHPNIHTHMSLSSTFTRLCIWACDTPCVMVLLLPH